MKYEGVQTQIKERCRVTSAVVGKKEERVLFICYTILLNQMSEEGPSDLLVKVLGITFHSTFKNLYYSSMNERGILEGVILQLFTMIIHPVPPDFIRLIV
jgi:hypothetical protein